MLQISVMWHRACFSLFIRPSLLHLCVICRKFHLHANCSEFGRTPPRVPATFPLTSWRARHTHTQTLNRWEILLKPCFKCSTFPVTTQWTSIDTSAYTLHAKNAPTQNATSQSSVEWKPLLWHQGLWFWSLGCYMLVAQSVHQSFWVVFFLWGGGFTEQKPNRATTRLVQDCAQICWHLLTETQVGTNREDQWAHLVKETLRIRHRGLVEACHS